MKARSRFDILCTLLLIPSLVCLGIILLPGLPSLFERRQPPVGQALPPKDPAEVPPTPPGGWMPTPFPQPGHIYSQAFLDSVETAPAGESQPITYEIAAPFERGFSGKRCFWLLRWTGSFLEVMDPYPFPLDCSGGVYALAADGQGRLYIGGQFSSAGDEPANGIALWDGQRWAGYHPEPYPGNGWFRPLSMTADAEGRITALGLYLTPVYSGLAAFHWTGERWETLGSVPHALVKQYQKAARLLFLTVEDPIHLYQDPPAP